jgi:hypothetical protein
LRQNFPGIIAAKAQRRKDPDAAEEDRRGYDAAMIQLAQILMIASTGQRYRHGQELRGRLGMMERHQEIGCARKFELALQQAADIGVVDSLTQIFVMLIPSLQIFKSGAGTRAAMAGDTEGGQPQHHPYEGWFSWAVSQLNAVRFHEGLPSLIGSDSMTWMVSQARGEELRHETVPATAVSMLRLFPAVIEWVEETGSDPRTTGASWQQVAQAVSTWRGLGKRIEVQKGGPVSPALTVALWSDGARIDRLISQTQFADEGNSMQHCVGGEGYVTLEADGSGSFWQESRDGRIAVFSYRDPEGVPRATLMVHLEMQRAEQLQGYGDKQVPDIARERICRFIESNLSVSTNSQVEGRCRCRENLSGTVRYHLYQQYAYLVDLEQTVYATLRGTQDPSDQGCRLGQAFRALIRQVDRRDDAWKVIQRKDPDEERAWLDERGRVAQVSYEQACGEIDWLIGSVLTERLYFNLVRQAGEPDKLKAGKPWETDCSPGFKRLVVPLTFHASVSENYRYTIFVEAPYTGGGVHYRMTRLEQNGSEETVAESETNPIQPVSTALKQIIDDRERQAWVYFAQLQLLPNSWLLHSSDQLIKELRQPWLGVDRMAWFKPAQLDGRGGIESIEVGSPDGNVFLRLLMQTEEGPTVELASVKYGANPRVLCAVLNELCGRFGGAAVDLRGASPTVRDRWMKLAEVVDGLHLEGSDPPTANR